MKMEIKDIGNKIPFFQHEFCLSILYGKDRLCRPDLCYPNKIEFEELREPDGLLSYRIKEIPGFTRHCETPDLENSWCAYHRFGCMACIYYDSQFLNYDQHVGFKKQKRNGRDFYYAIDKPQDCIHETIYGLFGYRPATIMYCDNCGVKKYCQLEKRMEA